MKINKFIDYTDLRPEATSEDIKKLCQEAIENDFASVCVNGAYVKLAKDLLRGRNVKIVAVIGFPLGSMASEVKSFEAIKAVQDGADELDMVINIGKLKEKDYNYVEEDIRRVCDSVNATVKVILENCKLTKEEIAHASEISYKSGADYVKTSTGFGGSGAEVEDILVMKEHCGTCKIKAAGGIRDYETAVKMIEAGASRIGVSKLIKNN